MTKRLLVECTYRHFDAKVNESWREWDIFWVKMITYLAFEYQCNFLYNGHIKRQPSRWLDCCGILRWSYLIDMTVMIELGMCTRLHYIHVESCWSRDNGPTKRWAKVHFVLVPQCFGLEFTPEQLPPSLGLVWPRRMLVKLVLLDCRNMWRVLFGLSWL